MKEIQVWGFKWGLTDYRQKAKNITDYRPDYRNGPTLSSLSIFLFSERRAYCIFSTCLRSNQRYHRLYEFYWKGKSEKPNNSCFDGRHKSFYKYTTKREYWSVSTEHMKISTEQPTYFYTLPASNVWGKYFKLQQNAWWAEATDTIWKKKCYQK